MGKFAALLRGINVGGHTKVSMEELKKTFEKMGFRNVKTILNTGNVVFEGETGKIKFIPGTLKEAFGFAIATIIVPFEAITEMAESNPFKMIRITPATRLYVTFLGEMPKTMMKIPHHSEDDSFQVIKITDTAVFTVLNLEKTGTTELMKFLETEFGKSITTRNYNTVMKMAEL